MNKGEIEALLSLVDSVRPQAVLEIGVNDGLTARAILDNIKTVTSYQGIDVPIGYVTGLKIQQREIPHRPGNLVIGDPRFELIVRPRGSLDLWPADLKPCDVAFIDGDHSRRVVIHDSKLATALVRPGGVIIYHDYHQLGGVDVRDVLDEMYATGRPIKRIEGTWLAFERKPTEQTQ